MTTRVFLPDPLLLGLCLIKETRNQGEAEMWLFPMHGCRQHGQHTARRTWLKAQSSPMEGPRYGQSETPQKGREWSSRFWQEGGRTSAPARSADLGLGSRQGRSPPALPSSSSASPPGASWSFIPPSSSLDSPWKETTLEGLRSHLRNPCREKQPSGQLTRRL